MKTICSSPAFFALMALITANSSHVAAQNLFLPEHEQFEKAQALWKSVGTQRYQLDYEKHGPDPLNTVYPWTVIVDPPNAPIAKDGNHNQINWAAPPTVDLLFKTIEDQLNTRTAIQIDVQYNPQQGYPQMIYMVLADRSIYDVDITNFQIQNAPANRNQNPTSVQQLAQAEALWKSHAIPNYKYQYSQLGSNPHNIVYPWAVNVQNSHTATGVDGNHNQILYEPHPQTMEEFFQRIRNAYSQNAKYIEVRYNKVYGFPEDIFIVYNDQTPDATYDAQVTNFLIQ
ncbi:expressed unknown protein [Seminavis robusta]|uniref:Uncharacterized protein n=1 Tax=Seminavis robusta TaxID=568900 RepID=A0A9N8EVK6_9STRA|nr:expressed unknown protein [Seminavis robusta]|eukprot:Sro2137_g316020.1 n/a (285) ;mRNA; r:5305-6159